MTLFSPLLMVIVLGMMPMQSETLKIDEEGSRIEFEARHFGVNKVTGSMRGLVGDIAFDVEEPEKAYFEVCLDASTLQTENEYRDAHLKDVEFLNVSAYPEVCFTATEVRKDGDGYIAEGDLMIKGITQRVEMAFEFENYVFTGHLQINRFDFDLGTKTWRLVVGKNVNVKIVCLTDRVRPLTLLDKIK